MTHPLVEALPEYLDLLELEPEELAWVLLPVLKKTDPRTLSVFNFTIGLTEYPRHALYDIHRAIAEAWGWMTCSGLLAPDPADSQGARVVITRRGRAIKTTKNFENFRSGSAMPRALLHPKIAEQAWSIFIRGQHDAAVLLAFRTVEETVRTAGSFEPEKVGTALMRDAFNPKIGPLTDQSAPMAEREALANLFAGAIGSHKNPRSHRTVITNEVIDAAELLMLASHLLRIVDDRAARRT